MKICSASITLEDEHGITRLLTYSEEEIQERLDALPFFAKAYVHSTLAGILADHRTTANADRRIGSEEPGEHGGDRPAETGTGKDLRPCRNPNNCRICSEIGK